MHDDNEAASNDNASGANDNASGANDNGSTTNDNDDSGELPTAFRLDGVWDDNGRHVIVEQNGVEVVGNYFTERYCDLDTGPVDAERVSEALSRTIRIQTISQSREAPPAARRAASPTGATFSRGLRTATRNASSPSISRP